MSTPILWLDLETTGLDCETGLILEVGAVLWPHGLDGDMHTQSQAMEERVFEGVVDLPYAEVQAAIGGNEYVRNMHTDNGLLDAIKHRRNVTKLMLMESMLVTWCLEAETKPVLAGNSVGFDKKWIEHHMPLLGEVIHHRVLDVSGPFLYGLPEALKGLSLPETSHRALPDLRNSILTLMHVRDSIGV